MRFGDVRVMKNPKLSKGSVIVRDRDGNTIFFGAAARMPDLPNAAELTVSEADHAKVSNAQFTGLLGSVRLSSA